MKKILLHGYTMDNLGDDLFFRIIAKRYPDIQFYLPTLNANYKDKFSDINNLKVIDFCGIEKVTTHKTYMLPKIYSYLFMRRFSAVVCIGGSLFIDRKNPTRNDRIEVENYSFIHDWRIAKNHRKPYFIIGANWGPCYNDYFYHFFSEAFNSMYDICFRDSYSWKEFADRRNVRKSHDILTASSFFQKQRGRKSVKNK